LLKAYFNDAKKKRPMTGKREQSHSACAYTLIHRKKRTARRKEENAISCKLKMLKSRKQKDNFGLLLDKYSRAKKTAGALCRANGAIAVPL
jgi:hypothetical protein